MAKQIITLTEGDLHRIVEEVIRECASEIVNEVYKSPKNNIYEFGLNAYSKKKKYAKPVWAIIERGYKKIGGCKTFDQINGDSGFNDFLNGRYVWRVYFGDSAKQILAVAIYKATVFGRKMVCAAAISKEMFNKLIDCDMNKSYHTYGEVSGKPEHILSKNKKVNWVNNSDVANIINKSIEIGRHPEADKGEETQFKRGIHYYRNIGGTKYRKALFGNPINIKKST